MSDVKWSKYQKDIFNFVEKGTGSAVVKAAAGSGKTTTAVEAANRIDKSKKVLFLAFNKSIVDELSSRFSANNISCKTLHGYGYAALMRSRLCGQTTKVNQNKWRDYFMNNLETLSNRYYKKYPKFREYIDNVETVMQLFDMCRINCIEGGNKQAVSDIAYRYGISDAEDEMIKVVSDVLKVAYIIKPGYQIDFVDMVCIPVMNKSLEKFCPKYDFVFIDEAQDLSLVQQKLMMMSIEDGGRFVAVGDPNQAINGFAGALSDSFDQLKELAGGKELPLSVNYRCPKNIIESVHDLVPDIQAHRGAKNGGLETVYDITKAKAGDMILSRYTSDLIILAMKMVKHRIKAVIKGKDIAANLRKTLQQAVDDGDNSRILSAKLDKERKRLEDNLAKGKASLSAIYAFQEKEESIKALMDGLDKPSDAISCLDSLFDDTYCSDAIQLSTIHKAKGLEADNVFILCSGILPITYEGQAGWEIQQERNLLYVAKTRTKKNLYLVDVLRSKLKEIEI